MLRRRRHANRQQSQDDLGSQRFDPAYRKRHRHGKMIHGTGILLGTKLFCQIFVKYNDETAAKDFNNREGLGLP